jgi:ADP-ribose pyrophosphatase
MHEPESLIQVVASHTLFDHPWVKIIQDDLRWHGREQKYFYLSSPVDAVATVGLTEAGEILLTRQYRHPVGQVIYDLPAGRLEPGEAALDGARREFEEETGYFPRHIQPIGAYNQFPGMLRVKTHLFFASDLMPSAQHLDEGEELQVVLLPVEKVLQMILQGATIDGSLQLGVLLALQHGLLSNIQNSR